MSRCQRSFTLLADGGVLVRWQCGTERVFPDETAVDVEVLRDHLPISHHHRHIHLPHLQGATA